MIIKNNEPIHIKIIHFYLTQFYNDKKTKSGIKIENLTPKNIFLQNIKINYNLNIDSDKFKEITLYYIKSKLVEHLTDSSTKEIFSNPIITPDGKTYELRTLNRANNYIQNKTVLEICKILKESGKELSFDNCEKIKDLLKSKETGEFFENPVVISSGQNKGETIEDLSYGNKFYKNIIIKNILKDIRDVLKKRFLKFEEFKTDEDIGNKINTNEFNNI